MIPLWIELAALRLALRYDPPSRELLHRCLLTLPRISQYALSTSCRQGLAEAYLLTHTRFGLRIAPLSVKQLAAMPSRHAGSLFAFFEQFFDAVSVEVRRCTPRAPHGGRYTCRLAHTLPGLAATWNVACGPDGDAEEESAFLSYFRKIFPHVPLTVMTRWSEIECGAELGKRFDDWSDYLFELSSASPREIDGWDSSGYVKAELSSPPVQNRLEKNALTWTALPLVLDEPTGPVLFHGAESLRELAVLRSQPLILPKHEFWLVRRKGA